LVTHSDRSTHSQSLLQRRCSDGSQLADVGGFIKKVLRKDDSLLNSLKKDNLYLSMLNNFRAQELSKESRYVCRPVHLHAAFEEKYIGPLLVVSPGSAAMSISSMVNSPVVGFKFDHFGIVKPNDRDHVVYRWTLERIEDEYMRLATWESANKPLCEFIPFFAEP
jgi:hypothetical protein